MIYTQYTLMSAEGRYYLLFVLTVYKQGLWHQFQSTTEFLFLLYDTGQTICQQGIFTFSQLAAMLFCSQFQLLELSLMVDRSIHLFATNTVTKFLKIFPNGTYHCILPFQACNYCSHKLFKIENRLKLHTIINICIQYLTEINESIRECGKSAPRDCGLANSFSNRLHFTKYSFLIL